MLRLSELQKGQKAIIKNFLQEDIFLKVLEMGLLPKSQVELISKAPLGDPINIRVQETMLSLRKAEAQEIEVVLLESYV
ncbi:MAG: FeoA family protein [Raineya sp.]